MTAWGHEPRFRYLRGTSAYPPRLAVKADIPDRQVCAKTGREQMQQHAVRGSQGYLITSSARVSTALSHSASLIKNRLLLDLQDGAQITQPALRRATPKLYLWDKLVALASGADTDHVHLRPFAHGA
jgi:hypothetical protein